MKQKKILFLIAITLIFISSFNGINTKHLNIKGDVGLINTNDTTSVSVKEINKTELIQILSFVKQIDNELEMLNDSTKSITFKKLHQIEQNQSNNSFLSWEFILTFFVALIALWTALRSSRSSRATAIISILQDSQIREARKEIFRKSENLSDDEISKSENDYRNKIELVCQSFDSVYRIYDSNETGILLKRNFNLVYKILIDSYWRSIIICYLKCYPVINDRRVNQKHSELWRGFERLFDIVCKTKKIKQDDYLISVIKSNKITDNIETFKSKCPKGFMDKAGEENNLKQLYKLTLKNIDEFIINKNVG